MSVNPVSAAAAPPTSSSTSSANDANNMFMQLLMAQLKGQSPIDPVDPNQFVGQLVQFNSLNQLLSMNSLLQQIASDLNPQPTATQPPSGGK
jgi:flagellar basal-body rod modification protein FlgD